MTVMKFVSCVSLRKGNKPTKGKNNVTNISQASPDANHAPAGRGEIERITCTIAKARELFDNAIGISIVIRLGTHDASSCVAVPLRRQEALAMLDRINNVPFIRLRRYLSDHSIQIVTAPP